MTDRIEFEIEETGAGARLDRALADALGSNASRSRAKALIEAGHARIDGTVITDPSRKVKTGERVALDIPPPESAKQEAEDIPLSVVHEDAHLIVVDKPAGLVVHPGAGNPDGTLVNALLRHCDGKLARAGGLLRPGIVHRLDKDTSGLIVAAKTDVAYRSLVEQFASHTIERGYHAIVHGVPRPAEGRIEGAIGRSAANRKKMALTPVGGKPAATDYRVLRAFKTAAALVECRPKTGRTHQIRVHLTSIGHPLIGDRLYGRRRIDLAEKASPAVAALLDRQALHAFLIAFSHPVSARRLSFHSETPHDLNGLTCELDRL